MITSQGYAKVCAHDHPRRDCNGRVFKHILVAEKALGKPLPDKAVVHHSNGSRNSGTLVICQDENYHKLLHRRMRAYKACGHAGWKRCQFCKQWDDPAKMYVDPKGQGRHRSCVNAYDKIRKQRYRAGGPKLLRGRRQ